MDRCVLCEVLHLLIMPRNENSNNKIEKTHAARESTTKGKGQRQRQKAKTKSKGKSKTKGKGQRQRQKAKTRHCHRQKPSTQIYYSSRRDLLTTLPSDPFASSLARRVLPWFEAGPILVVTRHQHRTTPLVICEQLLTMPVCS